jgi:hypothetical protein
MYRKSSYYGLNGFKTEIIIIVNLKTPNAQMAGK